MDDNSNLTVMDLCIYAMTLNVDLKQWLHVMLLQGGSELLMQRIADQCRYGQMPAALTHQAGVTDVKTQGEGSCGWHSWCWLNQPIPNPSPLRLP